MKKYLVAFFFTGIVLSGVHGYYGIPVTENARVAVSAAVAGNSDSELKKIEDPEFSAKVNGTGRTTGHIADVIVRNSSDESIVIAAQTFYIASDGKYQSYVGYIPEDVIVPSGEPVSIPVQGNCTNGRLPAVPSGADIPLDNLVPVGEPTIPATGTGTPVSLVPHGPVPEFSPSDIPGIIQGPGYRPNSKPRPGETPADWLVTYPGTDTPVGGTINPDKAPRIYASMIVRIVEQIEEATTVVQSTPTITTPFSPDPLKEKNAIAQNTIWFCMGLLTGETFTKEDFAENIYDQFENNTGLLVNILPPKEKENLDSGVDNFWESFIATGIEAKVIRSTQEKEGGPGLGEPIPSVPVVICDCETCIVTRPMRIVNQETKAEIVEDSIPTYIDQLRFYPVELHSDCPAECIPQNISEIRLEQQYNCIPSSQMNWILDSVERRVLGAGYVDVRTRYRCLCDSVTCGSGNDTRRLYFTESNRCCDRIRCNNNGQLRFHFQDGNVLVNGSQLVLTMDSGAREVFDFDFNLEAIFCNLDDNQIFAKLQTLASQNVSGQNVDEFLSSQDISLDHPTDIQDTRAWYSLAFSKTVNGREVAVSITIDESTCAFDLQIVYNDQVYEHAAPPFISPEDLRDMGISLGDQKQRRFWHRAMIVIGQLLRARQYHMEGAYQNAYLNFLSRLKSGVESLMNDPAYSAMRDDLTRLHDLLVQALLTRDYGLIDEIFNALVPVFNEMWR